MIEITPLFTVSDTFVYVIILKLSVFLDQIMIFTHVHLSVCCRSPFSAIDGTEYGPFAANSGNVLVPLWLALHLRKANQCNIAPPSWLTVDKLHEWFVQEGIQPEFSTVPFHYLEVAHLLLKHSSSNINDAQRLREALKDLEDVRACKLKNELQALKPDSEWVQLDGVGAMELQSVRSLCVSALKSFKAISQANQSGE